MKCIYILKYFKNAQLPKFRFLDDAVFWNIALYPSSFVFVSSQKEINGFKITAKMVSMCRQRGITLHFSKRGSSKVTLYFTAAATPKWLI